MARPSSDRSSAVAPTGGSPSAALDPPLAAMLADRLGAPVLAVGENREVVLANRRARSLLGLDTGALAGVALDDLVNGSQDVGEALERAIAEARPITLSGRLAGTDGDPCLLTLLPAGNGALILFESPAPPEDDDTRRLASLGRLSAGVAHEIRNPLSGIGTNAQVLRRRFEEGDPRLRFVDFILEEVTRLDKIIEDLLRFARPPEPRMVAHDLRDSIDKVLRLAAGKIEEAGVEVHIDAGDAPASVFVDPDQMAQVFLNLVLNAVQAMTGGGVLTIRLRVVERLGPVTRGAGRRASDRMASGPKRRFLEIVVRDTGIGIDLADRHKLFEPFFTTRPGGTGLGLSMSQVLVRQHGGAMSVESTLGRGTDVTVLLPVEKRRAAR